jgi:hypothetical protein
MGSLKYKFLILISLVSTLSWAAPPRVSSDPRRNCELLLSAGREITLPGARPTDGNSIRPPNEMIFMTHNLRNFFSLSEKMSRNQIIDPKMREEFASAINKNGKSRDDLLGHARIIRDEIPDVFIGQEIDGEEMWKEFNKNYLDGRYVPFLMQEKTSRRPQAVVKDIGFLFNPSLPFMMRAFSHRQLSFRDPLDGSVSPLYFRDLPVLEIRGPNAERNGLPPLIVISAHLISQKKDHRVLRKAQLDWIASIIENRRKEYGKDVGIIVGGDFNIDINADYRLLNEFFERTKLENPFSRPEFVTRKRTTHIFFKPGERPVFHQLDGFLVSQSLATRVRDIRVVPHRDENGKVRTLPTNHTEKDEDLSDHYPLRMVLDTEGLF